MKQMLEQGGDTDTNCAIVGGLIGARDGVKGIKSEWVDKVLSFRCDNDEECNSRGVINKRDDFLIPVLYLPPFL